VSGKDDHDEEGGAATPPAPSPSAAALSRALLKVAYLSLNDDPEEAIELADIARDLEEGRTFRPKPPGDPTI
jgi:hypothetical protein